MITPEKLAILAARPDLPEDIRDALSDASVQLSNSSAEQALVVERLRVPLQFMVDSIAEDKAYVAEKYPILFALIQARRAEMGTLGGVQVFGEIARDLLGILAADPSGEAALTALRARALPAKRPDQPAHIVEYTNWRGETARRTIIPIRMWWGATEWHPEEQWILTAWDVEKDAARDFAWQDMRPVQNPATSSARAALAEVQTEIK